MKNKKLFFTALCALLLIVLFSSQTIAQQYGTYPKGKIIMKNGNIVEGKNLVFTSSSVTITIGMSAQNFELEDVSQIMVKQNKAMKGCMYGAGGCAAIGLFAYLAGDDETFEETYGTSKSESSGQYFLGLALWTGCFGGVGYLIGSATDNWQIIYVSSSAENESNSEIDSKLASHITPAFILGRYMANQ